MNMNSAFPDSRASSFCALFLAKRHNESVLKSSSTLRSWVTRRKTQATYPKMMAGIAPLTLKIAQKVLKCCRGNVLESHCLFVAESVLKGCHGPFRRGRCRGTSLKWIPRHRVPTRHIVAICHDQSQLRRYSELYPPWLVVSASE